MASVLHVPAFDDNYIWLIRGTDAPHVAIVDPGEATPVLDLMEREGMRPVAVLCTHHHGDHVGGVAEIVARHAVPVYGPANEHIGEITHPVKDGERIGLAELDIKLTVIAVPGHTAGHVAYAGDDMLFCGDTLFSAGCGRLFEGTAAQMHASLARLKRLHDGTRVYCAHEYTAANLRFAAAVEPDNAAIRAYHGQVLARRAANQPSLPSTIGVEKTINPFLRTDVPAVKHAAEQWIGHPLAGEAEVFAVIRRWKDGFRG